MKPSAASSIPLPPRAHENPAVGGGAEPPSLLQTVSGAYDITSHQTSFFCRCAHARGPGGNPARFSCIYARARSWVCCAGVLRAAPAMSCLLAG